MRAWQGLVLVVATWMAAAGLSFATPAPGTPQDDFLKPLAAADYAPAQRLADEQLKRARGVEAAFWLNAQGMLKEVRGRFGDAYTLFLQSYRMRRKHLGPRHPDTTVALNNMALMEEQTGRYSAALKHFRQALLINTRQLGPAHKRSVTNLSNIGLLHLTLGHIREADTDLTRALDLTTRAEGWWAQNTAIALSNLASVKVTAFRFAEAGRLLTRALSIDEYRHGPSHPDVAVTLNNIGELHRLQGHFLEAQQAFQRAAAIDRAFAGEYSHAYAIDMLNLGTLFGDASRLHEARAAILTAQSILATTAPGNPELSAEALSALAHVLCRDGNCDHAEPLVKLASARLESAFGIHSAATLQVINDLAMLHSAAGQLEQAARDMKRYLAGAEAAFGSESPAALRARLRWAESLMASGRRHDARRAIAGLRRRIIDAFGRTTMDAARLNLLEARLALAEGHPADASRLAHQALRGTRGIAGANAMQAAEILDLLAGIYARQGQWQKAWRASRQALHALEGRLSRAALMERRTTEEERAILRNTIRVAIASSQHMRDGASPLSSALEAADLLADDAGERAMLRGAIRRSTSDRQSLQLLKRQSTVIAQLKSLDDRTSTLFAAGTYTQDIERRRRSLANELDRSDRELARRLPRYAHLSGPRDLTLRQVQHMLRGGEMLLYVLPLGDVIAVLAVTRDASTGHVVPVSSTELSSSVDALRQGLDPARWHNTVEPFPREAAYRLYNLLLKPVAPMLRHSRTMFVVAGTPLSALPMSVLVTKPPLGGVAGDSSPDALRNTAWLGRDIGIVRIPSASAISLRETIGDDRPTSEAFLGVGAPRATAQSPALPAAEGELRRIAVALGEPTASVLSGLSATKAAFLSSAPGRKRVIAFATHALTARENPAGEPALVLTRSREEKGTPYDTLPASEIATLELSSDWVILSGCNTAGDGAQSASTLARAFLQAGARSLLVSHWPVSDRAAALMTTTVMSEYAERPTNGQAEALRRAIGKTITDASHPLNAHPSSWAAFSLYGEASSSSGRED